MNTGKTDYRFAFDFGSRCSSVGTVTRLWGGQRFLGRRKNVFASSKLP